MIEVKFILFSRKIVALLISSSLIVGTAAPVFAETISLPMATSVQTPGNAQSTGEYHLSKYDVINIVIVGFSEGFFSDKGSDIMIGPDGYVNLPYAGSVKLVGLTVQEASAVVKAKLEEYMKIPSLSMMVKQYGPRKVYVIGEVVKPGIFEMNSEYMNVFAALSGAGGITRRGRPKHIQVIRMVDGKMMMQEVNFDRFIEKQDGSQNLSLIDGDMVFVPKSDKILFDEDIMPYISTYGVFRSLIR